MTGAPSDKVLVVRLDEVMEMLGIGDTMFRKLVRDGTLPRPVRINTRASGIPSHELSVILEAVNNGATTDELRQIVSRIHSDRVLAPNAPWVKKNG